MERDPLTGERRPAAGTAQHRRRLGRAPLVGVLVAVAVTFGGWVWRSRRTPPAPETPSAVPAPADAEAGTTTPSTRVIIEVLNASGIRGLGRRATAVLRERGFDVVYTANAPDTTRRDSTLVLDRAGRPEDAARVARALGGARVEARTDSSRYVHVTVLLGGAWRPPANALYP